MQLASTLAAAEAGRGTEPHDNRSFPEAWMLNGSRLMSRAFVNDADYLEELPERPISEHPNDVTEAGLAQIEQALAAASEAYAAAQASADRAALAAAGRDLRYWVRPARDRARRTCPGRPLRSTVWHISDDHTRRWQGTDVSGRRRRRSRPRQRLDLTCLAAGEIDVRKARRRRCQSRQRGSRDYPDPVTALSRSPAWPRGPSQAAFAYDHPGEEVGEGADRTDGNEVLEREI
jgi:hypothetical protein